MKRHLAIFALLLPLIACAHAQVSMGGQLTMDGGLHVQGNPNISIITLSLPNGVLGVPYSQTIQTANGKGTISFSLAQGALPDGLSLNPTTGVIAGTPTAAGSYSFVIRADATGPPAKFDTHSYTVVIGCPPLVITAATLPVGVVGSPYSFQLQSAGGILPVTWSISSGLLPAGLSISSGGLISGTPTTVETQNPIIQAQDSCVPVPQRSLLRFTIAVVSPVIITTVSPLSQATEGLLYNTSFAAAGGTSPYTWSLASGTLPAGLTLTSGGVLSGTPTAAGTKSFGIKVTDSAANTTTASFSLTVACTPLIVTTTSLPTGQPATPYSAQLTSSGGTGAVTWSVVVGSLPAGLTLSTTGVISGTPTQNGTFSIGFQAQDSCLPTAQKTLATLNLTILTPVLITTTSPLPNGIQGQPYSVQLSASGGTPPYTWSGSASPGLTISSAGLVSGTPTTSGTGTVAAQVQDTGGLTATASLQLTITCPALSITSLAPLPTATIGQAYNFQFTSSGGVPPLVWSGQPLPPGLGISSGGLFGGIPTTAGVFNPSISVHDSCFPTVQTTAGLFGITVVSQLAITTTSPLPAATEGQSYSAQMAAAGGTPPYSWTVIGGTLPAGLSLSGGGLISGTPTTAGTFVSTIRVQDAGAVHTATGSFSITVSCVPLSITTGSTLQTGTQGTAYSQQLQASGGNGAKSWTLLAGSLPAGVTLSAGGLISGTPTNFGTFTPTIQVQDSCSPTPQVLSRAFTLVVNSTVTILSTSPLPAATEGVAYSFQMQASAGVPPYTWSLTGGSLPTGLSISGGGSITGTPSATGTSTATLRVTDSAASTASGSFSITVSCIPLAITTTSPLQTGTQSVAYSQQLQASGGTGSLTWSLASGTLPTGITLSAGGLLSGTPSVTGTFSPNIQVHDSCSPTAQVDSHTFTLVISPAVVPVTIVSTSPLPGATEGQAYSFQLQASGGTPAYTWSITAGTLPAGLSLSSGGAITGTPTASGTVSVTIKVTDSLAANASSVFSITVSCVPLSITTGATLQTGTSGQAYSAQLASTGGTGSVTWSLIGGTLPTGVTLSSGGTLSGTPSVAGSFSPVIQATDSCLPVNQTASKTFSLTILAPVSFVTTSPLPPATEGQAYSFTMQASGGVPPYTWAVTAGALPAGLSLSSAGAITGTPTSAGTVSPTIRVTDSAATAISSPFSITVSCVPLTLVSTSPLPTGTQGTAYSSQLSSSGGTGTKTWSVTSGTLPAGITLSTAGLLSGTPSVAGTFSVTIQVHDSCLPTNQTASTTFSLTINGLPAIITTSPLPTATEGQAYSVQLAATGGTPPYTWSITSGALPPNLTLSSTGIVSGIPVETSNYVDLSWTASPTAGVTYNVKRGTTSGSEVTIASGILTTTYRDPTVQPGTTYFYVVSATLSGSESANSNEVSFVIPALPTIQVRDSNAQTASRVFTVPVVCSTLSITSTSPLANGTQGSPYSQQLQSTGGTGAVTWAVTAGALPGGITLSSNGALTGTPSVSGSFSATITTTDSCVPTPQAVAKAFSLTISPSTPTLTITTSNPLPAGTQGVAYNANMTASGGVPPYTWTIASGSLPAGLSLSGTGTITGQPTTVGISTAVIRVTDSASTAVTGSFSITISCVALLISSNSPLPPGTISTAYSQQLQSQGGTGALTWSLSSGSFPTGVSISAGGLISGTPSASGSFTPTIGLHDSCSTPQVVTKPFSLTIAALLTITTTSPLPAATPGQPYSVTITAAGGTPPYTWSNPGGGLPTGLSLNASTGVISGTPASGGFVQVNSATPQIASTSVPVAFLSNQASGNLNVIAVGWNDTTSTVSTVTDTRGNTYTQAGTLVTGTGIRQSIYYAKNIAAGANTVTVAFNQAAALVDVRILEYSGLDITTPLDVTAGAVGTSTAANSGSATTTSANEILFGAGMTSARFSAPGSGFTTRVITGADGDIAEDQIVSSTGSYSATATTSTGNWIMQLATFKAVGGLGNSTFTIQVTDNAAQTASKVFTMNQPAHTVTVAWTASVTPSVTYNVYRGTTTGGPYPVTVSSGSSALNALDQTVQPATTYFYVVRSQVGTTESGNSNQATACIPSQPTCP